MIDIICTVIMYYTSDHDGMHAGDFDFVLFGRFPRKKIFEIGRFRNFLHDFAFEMQYCILRVFYPFARAEKFQKLQDRLGRRGNP